MNNSRSFSVIAASSLFWLGKAGSASCVLALNPKMTRDLFIPLPAQVTSRVTGGLLIAARAANTAPTETNRT